MTRNAVTAPARLFTVFGTVVYVDGSTGELRHGPLDTSAANVALVAAADELPPHPRYRLVHQAFASEGQVLVGPDGRLVAISDEAPEPSDGGARLEVVPLERGLFGLRHEDLFLCAEPNGRLALSRKVCSVWESFLASESWCAEVTATPPAPDTVHNRAIREFLIDPRLRSQSGVGASATKILIYGYPRWSHGRVYYDLCKHLCARGYVVDIIDWQQDHSEYFEKLAGYYDFFMTAPDGVRTLMDAYGVPPERMIVVSHHEMDIRILTEQMGADIFDRFAAYGVVSYFVYCASMMQGVRRPPQVASLGIDYSTFFMPVPERLETVGYASSMSVTTFGVEWKRGHLAEAAAREAGLVFKVAGSTGHQTSFHDMPDFYRTVEAVLTSSISEAAQLPVMEAAAAGRLVIGTPVGHFPLKAYQGGGIIAPIEADKFVAFVAEQLRYYRNNPSALVEKCQSIQEAAHGFDWKYAIGDWVELIQAARSA